MANGEKKKYKWFGNYEPPKLYAISEKKSSNPPSIGVGKLLASIREAEARRLSRNEGANRAKGSVGKSSVKPRSAEEKTSLRTIIEIADSAGVKWRPDHGIAVRPIHREEDLGSRTQISAPSIPSRSDRELVIGLDFGTSSTKVAITDQTLDVTYAVPLTDTVGVGAYLLASSLFENYEGHYSIDDGVIVHKDLKLTMLRNFQDEASCSRVCAFLALVLRNCRAWLFANKGEQYLHVDILWTVVLGQPADPDRSAAWRVHFEDLARVAWRLSRTNGPITKEQARRAWNMKGDANNDEDLEVRAIAELSAQIHGFVSSSHFDPRVPNIYLMADVGGGTIDASVFRVKKLDDGGVKLSIFTHSVGFFGASRLNFERVDWWKNLFRKLIERKDSSAMANLDKIDCVMRDLDGLYLPTEFRGRYPDRDMDYLTGVRVYLAEGEKSADAIFFGKVLQQISGQVLHKCWKANKLSQDAIKGMPFFLCGGGARHPFYLCLNQELQHTPNSSWLRVSPRGLVLPEKLSAPGVAAKDYDRLSVAYGLSRLSRALLTDAPAILKPVVATDRIDDFISSTVDKSSC